MRIQIKYYRRKANIDTDRGDIQSACSIRDWKKRYKATDDVKPKVRCPVNKKIIPEKDALFDNIEQGCEF